MDCGLTPWNCGSKCQWFVPLCIGRLKVRGWSVTVLVAFCRLMEMKTWRYLHSESIYQTIPSLKHFVSVIGCSCCYRQPITAEWLIASPKLSHRLNTNCYANPFRPPDIVVGGLKFYHDSSSSFFVSNPPSSLNWPLVVWQSLTAVVFWWVWQTEPAQLAFSRNII